MIRYTIISIIALMLVYEISSASTYMQEINSNHILCIIAALLIVIACSVTSISRTLKPKKKKKNTE